MSKKKNIDIQGRFVEKVNCMLVYEEIKFYMNRYKGEQPTITTLSNRFGVHRDTIKNRIEQLAERGFVKLNKDFKNTKNYVLTNKKVSEN